MTARAAFVAVLVMSGGCYQAASSINSNLSDAFFNLAALVVGTFGLLGLVLAWSVARQRVSWLTLAACWVGCAPVLIITLLATELFFPWPGTFRRDGLLLLWLPQPIVIAALFATGRFTADKLGARVTPARIATLIPICIYCGLLANASVRGYARPAVAGTIVQVAVTDGAAFQRSDQGMVVVWSRAMPGRYSKLAAGSSLALAMSESGALVRLPDNPRNGPIDIDTGGAVIDIAAAGSSGCFSTANGVSCFELPASNASTLGPAPTRVAGFDGVTDIAMSKTMVCGIGAGGRVVCAAFGGVQLGLLSGSSLGAIAAAGASDVAVTNQAACVLASGRVSCAVDSARPVPLDAGPGDIAQIVAGAFHFCARHEGGRVSCWGGNGWQQLGPGTLLGESDSPVEVPLASPAVEIFAQATSTCARLENGEIHCWGAQKEPGSVLIANVCHESFFGPPTRCSAMPAPIHLAKTAIPFRE